MPENKIGVPDLPDIGAGVPVKRLLTTEATRTISGSPTVVQMEKLIPSDINGDDLPAGKYATQSFTAAGAGATVDSSAQPPRSFSLQVASVGGSATTWRVVLEGSLNNLQFSEFMEHTKGPHADGEVVYSGGALFPCRFFRTRVVSLDLGTATSLRVDVLGK